HADVLRGVAGEAGGQDLAQDDAHGVAVERAGLAADFLGRDVLPAFASLAGFAFLLGLALFGREIALTLGLDRALVWWRAVFFPPGGQVLGQCGIGREELAFPRDRRQRQRG